MMPKSSQSGQSTFTFRIDASLKKEFMAATKTENRPVARVLRDFMASYIERKERKEFEAEAHRQSSLVANSPEEKQVMDWIKDVADGEGWN